MLFWLVLVFLFAQAFFMAKGIENVPFFLYYMYGKKHPPRDSIGVYLIKTPQGYFNHKKLSNREQEILTNTVSYYVNLRRDGDGIGESVKKRFQKWVSASNYEYMLTHLKNDSSSLASFPQWWGRYFQSVTNSGYDSVHVVKTYVYSKPPYHKFETDSLIFTVKLQ
jgi:hypothetical protein